ncbi:MAG: serine/threonine protein phosphatase, partial [Rhizorhabdus sp.]
SLIRDWLRWGGLATLKSYGVMLPRVNDPVERNQIISDAISAALPPHHRDFLDRLEVSIQSGDYLFVHAGIRPGRSVEGQSRHDMLSIREPFLSSGKILPCRVVHGHSVAFEVQSMPCRIGIDTGAYATGRLSSVMIEGDRTEILSVSSGK